MKWRSNLISWYSKNARVLPWRTDPTPYHVLLSELMLQQTRVDTVLPYYANFLQRWPNLKALAAAPLEDLEHAWQGLGYYNRVRNLHKLANLLESEGGLPGEVSSLLKLPGIGPYSAGAIASIAFGRPAALVDGNVERVLSRIYNYQTDIRSKEGKKWVWERAQELLLRDHPGAWNQALMELGALICSPKNPSCDVCPVKEHCVGFLHKAHLGLPNKPKKKKPVPIFSVSLVLHHQGQVVFVKRPAKGLLANLWEPMAYPLKSLPATPNEVAALGIGAKLHLAAPLRYCGEVKHVFSHRKLRAWVFSADVTDLPRLPHGYCALQTGRRESFALSTLAKKVLDCAGVLEGEPQGGG